MEHVNPTDRNYLCPSTRVGIDLPGIYGLILHFLRGISAEERKWKVIMNSLNTVGIELIHNEHFFFFFSYSNVY